MTWAYNLDWEVWLFVASGLLPLVQAMSMWPSRSKPAAANLLVLLLTISFWSFTGALEEAVVGVEGKIFWSQMTYVGVTGTPLLFLLFTLRLTWRQPPRGTHLVALAFLPVLTLLLVWTNSLHGLVWESVTLPPELNGRAFYNRGPWFWVYVPTAYIYNLVGLIYLSRFGYVNRRLFRSQAIMLALAVPLPWIASITYILRISPIEGLDTTPMGFCVSAAMIAIGIYRYGLGDLLPVAHREVIDSLEEGVIVIDSTDRVVDVNAAAARFFGSSALPIGADAGCLGGPFLMVPGEVREIMSHDGQLHLNARSIAIRSGNQATSVGRILVVQDVTGVRLAQQELARKNDELERLAMTDELTALPNRRYMLGDLARELARLERHSVSLTVALMDLDHFKNVNDSYGHAVGDRVLKLASQAMMKGLRSTDVVGRFGGEEFLLLMGHTGEKDGLAVVERLRSLIRSTLNSEMGLAITVSAGVTAAVPGDTADSVLGRADRAMYQAKAEGRDRACSHEGK